MSLQFYVKISLIEIKNKYMFSGLAAESKLKKRGKDVATT
jgi:hypothetical protein